MFMQVKLQLLAALPQILQRASFKLGNPLNIVSGGMEFMVMMLSVTVEPMSAMQRRCWKTGFKMEGDVSYFFNLIFRNKKKFKGHVTNSFLLIFLKKSRVKFKMHSASVNSKIEYLKNIKRKVWTKISN